MPALFQRRCSLIMVPPIAGSLKRSNASTGILAQELRVNFKIEKTVTKEPNRALIQIFNLASSTRAKLQARGTRVLLSAGYGEDLSLLFDGDSRTIDHVRDGADWVTKIQSGDGERHQRYAVFSGSFRPGAKIKDIVLQLVNALQLDPGNAAAQLTNVVDQFVSGYASHGKASTELDSILSGLGIEWSIQDGQIQLLAPGEVTKDSAVLVNQQSGMVGSPEHGTPEVLGGPGILRVKSLLNPLIKPGRRIKVESVSTNGFFRVEKVSHSGDTHKGDWYSTVEARALGVL